MKKPSEILSHGMEILMENMGIIEAETFIFLLKSEEFDYTQWQREYFDRKSKAELDAGMDAYFASNPCSIDPARRV